MYSLEFYDVMKKLCEITAMTNILRDYLEFNINSQQMGYALCLVQNLAIDIENLYNQMDIISFELFDFREKNLK